MEVVYQRCCGLDVHKKTITVCVLTPEKKEIRTFGTMTEELLKLTDWVLDNNCTHVAMESTADYWKPIYNLMELTDLKLLVVNSQHVKAVPGRKTDVKDAEWIASLLRHGLLQGSFIPSRDHRELRELVRYRRSLVQERSREVNRIQKILEGANIKLSSVVSDVVGVSGKLMLNELCKGIEDPKVLAQFAKGTMRKKIDQLEKALQGLVGPHQKLILASQLSHIEFLDQQLEQISQEIEKRMRPFEKDLELLDTIPGIGRKTAEHILAEIGTDMSRFPSAAHLASWSGMAPGNNKSAGKRKSGKTPKGNKYLRSALVEAAHAAAKSKDSYLSAQYRRIAARRGNKRAAVAVGHTILVIIYHMLITKQSYKELGANYFEFLRKNTIVNRAVKQLENLGYKVSLESNIA